jgi:hypothetical protein
VSIGLERQTLITACSDGGVYYWDVSGGGSGGGVGCGRGGVKWLREEHAFLHKDWVTKVVLLGGCGGGGGWGGEVDDRGGREDGLGAGGGELRVVSSGLDMDLVVSPYPR